MRWQMARRSTNVEDRRGMRVGRPVAFGGVGILVALVVAVLFGADPGEILRLLGGGDAAPTSADIESRRPVPGAAGARDEQADFVSAVLGDTEDTWTQIFAERGGRYEPPTLSLFTDVAESACGFNSAAVGPFYCPADAKVYIDLGFYRDLRERFGAPGDFAQAYVIAHEIGHHVQNLLGISDEVERARRGLSQAESNESSVRLELQADCFAGVWGHHAESRLLEAGDVEEGLRAAAAIGDDRMQRMSTGRVHPESWTHGSSEQRVRWFRRGFESGQMEQCDTFTSAAL